jgi:glycosyltransferase involved in cell wall biosynthesis
MKILIANKFFYPKGGSEISMFNIAEILLQHGHEIKFFSMKDSKNIKSEDDKYFVSFIDFHQLNSFFKKIYAFFRVLYSFEAKRKIELLIKEFKPEILFAHNIAHHITPSIFHLAKKHNIKIIQFMHDFKVVCPSYLMKWGNGVICDGLCRNKKFFWCTIKKCSHNNFFWSLTNTLEMYLHHSILHSYDLVDVYISPSRFLKNKVEEMGFKKKIVVLPNFVWLDEFEPSYEFEENTICYFGRLSKEKGLFTLLNAVKGLNVKLKIIGEGPLKDELQNLAASFSLRDKENIKFLGYKTGEELKNEIKKSMFVVLPSEWYENNPRAVLESFALGKPVIGSRIGGIPELVIDGLTGYTFEVGNVEDLREKILYLIKNSQKVIELGKKARKFVEDNHNPKIYYEKLMKILSDCLKSST